MKSVSEVLRGSLYLGGKTAAENMATPPTIHVCTAPCTHSKSSKIVRFPLKDEAGWSWNEDDAGTERLVRLAKTLAKVVLEGKSVLVTCETGENSSSLVIGLTLCAMGYTPQQAVELIQELSGPDALSNEGFYDCVCELGGTLSRSPVQTYRTRRSPTLQLSEQA